MKYKQWFEVCEEISSHVFRISTPRGTGTGFLLSKTEDSQTCSIATAAHVIDHAHLWDTPIQVQHHASGKVMKLGIKDRAVFVDADTDTAAIIIDASDFDLPADPLPLGPQDRTLKIGFEAGWFGFPAVSPNLLCFFSGRVSAFDHSNHAYLVDGVAINGVSGGPAVFNGMNEITLIGVVSAYIANRATGEPLPGVSVIRDVSHLHSVVEIFNSVTEAKKEESQPEELPPEGSPDSTA